MGYCDSCKWTNSIEASMRTLPDDQLQMSFFAAAEELQRRNYKIEKHHALDYFSIDRPDGFTLDDVDTHQDECLCCLVKRIAENKDRLIPEDHLVLADVVEILSSVGDYGED
jgi:hypothetical protein